MSKGPRKSKEHQNDLSLAGYDAVLGEITELLESARRAAARTVNAIMTATYWEIGRQIIQFEQMGEERADYGERVIRRLAQDLTDRFGRGFGRSNLYQMRAFYLTYVEIVQTPSGQLTDKTTPQKVQTPSAQFDLGTLASHFPLPWSHYVQLLAVKNPEAHRFYEAEAIRGGWSIRQLKRQIGSQFYERAALSRNKAAMLHT